MMYAPVSRILVGFDGSDGVKRALGRAVVEARDGMCAPWS
jgi:nucleotide-binding universal stress UspA family protein